MNGLDPPGPVGGLKKRPRTIPQAEPVSFLLQGPKVAAQIAQPFLGSGGRRRTERHLDEGKGDSFLFLTPHLTQAAARSDMLGNNEHSLIQRMGAEGEELEVSLVELGLLGPEGNGADYDAQPPAAHTVGLADTVTEILEAATASVTSSAALSASATAGDASAASGIAGTAAAAAAAIPVSSACGVHKRNDKLDKFVLPGDISDDALRLLDEDSSYTAILLRNLAHSHFMPIVTVTALLALLYGNFGVRLGLQSFILERLLPKDGRVVHDRAKRALSVVAVKGKLERVTVKLPDDDNLVGNGRLREAVGYASSDLAYKFAYKLMDPNLNNKQTPIYFEQCPPSPVGIHCAGSYTSEREQAKRDAAFKRARDMLPEDVAAQIPGTPLDQVGILACGVRVFIDGLSPYKNKSKSANALLAALTNWHPAVAQSPQTVVLGGVYFESQVLKAVKVANADVGHSASPATMARAATVDASMLREIAAIPIRKLLTRRCLIVRAASLLGLPSDFPQARIMSLGGFPVCAVSC